MNRATSESLASLLQQVRESTVEILKRFNERLQACAGPGRVREDLTAQRWSLEFSAAQARVQLRDVHRRISRAIGTLCARNIISDGEAAPVERSLEQLLGKAMNDIEEHLDRARARK